MDITTVLSAYSRIIPKKPEMYQCVHFSGGSAVALTNEIRAEVHSVVAPTVRASVNHARLNRAVQAIESPALSWSGNAVSVTGGGNKFSLPVFYRSLSSWPVTVPVPIATVCRKDLQNLMRAVVAADETEADKEPVVLFEAGNGKVRVSSGSGLACATSWIDVDVVVGYSGSISSTVLAKALQCLEDLEADDVDLAQLGSGLLFNWSDGRLVVQESFGVGFADGGKLDSMAAEAVDLACCRDSLVKFFSSAAYLVDKDSDTVEIEPMGNKVVARYVSGFGSYEADISADAVGEAFKVSLSRLSRAVKSASENVRLMKSDNAVVLRDDNFIAAIALSV